MGHGLPHRRDRQSGRWAGQKRGSHPAFGHWLARRRAPTAPAAGAPVASAPGLRPGGIAAQAQRAPRARASPGLGGGGGVARQTGCGAAGMHHRLSAGGLMLARSMNCDCSMDFDGGSCAQNNGAREHDVVQASARTLGATRTFAQPTARSGDPDGVAAHGPSSQVSGKHGDTAQHGRRFPRLAQRRRKNSQRSSSKAAALA